MRFSLSTWVLIGFVAGVAAGLFAGEYCAPLQTVGDVYVGLLQMTVLPYIVASLIVNLGRLDLSTMRRLATAVSGVMAVLWLLMALLLLILPLALPQWRAGSFFSACMLETPPQMNLLELFVPANPFQALAENIVPATVLFSMCLGVGLISVENKQPLLDTLQAVLSALSRINHAIALSSPVGVFAIMAATAGTLNLDQFTRLQAYLLIYLLGTLLAALLILPLLVASTTPIRYRSFLRVAWAPMLTAFATGKTLIVLPMIAEGTSQLLQESGARVPDGHESAVAGPSALVALAYPFPHLGKLISLLFVSFGAWFVGSPMDLSAYPAFLGAGFVSMFGSVLAAIPFLLDLEHLPSDLFQMFLGSGVVCGRLGDMLGAVSLLAFTVLSSCVLERRLRIRVGTLVWRSGIALVAVLLAVGVARAILTPVVRHLPSKGQVLLNMHTTVVPVDEKIWTTPPPTDPVDSALTRLHRIERRGALRVGCLVDNLPFSFRNEAGQLVGFDIDMAHLLASELDCALWLVPLTAQQMTSALDQDTIDLAMCGIVMTTDRLQAATFTRPYLRVTMSLLVQDFRRREFSSLENIRRMDHLRVCAMPSRQYEKQLVALCPQAEVLTIQSPQEFFINPALEADALLISAEAGAAWTLIYPQFTPVPVLPRQHSFALAYPIAGRDIAFADFMNQWIELKSTSPEFHRLYDYWILGRAAADKQPRWSIMRDVLGWGSR